MRCWDPILIFGFGLDLTGGGREIASVAARLAIAATAPDPDYFAKPWRAGAAAGAGLSTDLRPG